MPQPPRRVELEATPILLGARPLLWRVVADPTKARRLPELHLSYGASAEASPSIDDASAAPGGRLRL
jgi:hypothetical protein